MAKNVVTKKDRPTLGVFVRNPNEERVVVFGRVLPATKDWLQREQSKSGAKNIGEYLDALVGTLRTINKDEPKK